MKEQVILITGATDGLGRAAAMQLAQLGATLLLHGRNPEKGAALLSEIKQASGNDKLHYFNADLASLKAVRELAAEVNSKHSRLNVLVNNAGIGPRKPGSPRMLSADGHEMFFAVNYLAGYLLCKELLPLLRQSAPARIVNIASLGQQTLDFANLMLEHDYDDARAYRQSKLAQILFTFDLAAALAGSGITVNCLHPASLMNTRMVLDSAYFPGTMSTVEQGTAALLYLVCAPELAAVSGKYFEGKQEARAQDQAYDAAARQLLHNISEQLTNQI